MGKVKVLPRELEFHPLAAIFPLMEGAEFDALKADIESQGQLEPIYLHEGKVLDGRNRYRACRAVGREPETRTWEGKDPLAYIVSLNLKRRHLDEGQRDMAGARIANLGEGRPGKTASIEAVSQEKAANLLNVSRSGIQRAAKVIKDGVPELAAAVDAGKLSVSAAAEATKKAPRQQKEIAEQAQAGKSTTAREVAEMDSLGLADKTPHVAHNSGENEWYTPEEIIKAVRKTMERIDLDPASTEMANEKIKAAKIYTIETDGLTQKWEGRIFLNPPYASDLIGRFAEKLIKEIRAKHTEAAVVLVNNATETKWFQSLLGMAEAVCFPAGRVRFWNPRNEKAAPLQGQAVFYFGKHKETFVQAFEGFGLVCQVF